MFFFLILISSGKFYLYKLLTIVWKKRKTNSIHASAFVSLWYIVTLFSVLYFKYSEQNLSKYKYGWVFYIFSVK